MIPLLLCSLALAAELRPKVDPTQLASHRSTWALYNGTTYGGMLTLDGAAVETGGATLVVRFVPAGQGKASWLEGVTVDAQGQLTEVVRREGRRIRTLRVEGPQIRDVVTEGQEATPLSERTHAVSGPTLSPWLLPLVIPGLRAGAGDDWQGVLVDAAQLDPAEAKLSALGRQEVGGGRKAQVISLQTGAGQSLRYIYDAETVTAIVDSAAGSQWVAASREQLKAHHPN